MNWEDIKLFEVTTTHLLMAYTKEEAIEHVKKSTFYNKILKVKELPQEKGDPQE